MKQHPNAAIAERLWSAVADGDADGIREVLADGVVWRSYGRNPLAGERRGADAVLDYFARIGESSEGLVSTLEGIFAGDDGAVIIYHTEATRDSRKLDLDYVLVLRIEKGRIRRASSIPADQYANDRFWR